MPGQTLVYADGEGRVGKLRAARLPRRASTAPDDFVSAPADMAAWREDATAADLPAEFDPPQGFVVSANDRPPAGDIPIGWFFAPNDRAERLSELLSASDTIGFADLALLQTDVAAPRVLELRDRLCAAVAAPPRGSGIFAAMAAWDGAYDAESPGALAFELVLAHLVTAVIPPERRALYSAVWHSRSLLGRDIDGLAPERLSQAVKAALLAAQPAFARLRCWGGAHRLRLAHPLGAIVGIGRRYRFADWAWPGSDETVFKSSHGLVTGRHAVAYGSDARYLFDLSDPDGNHLVLLGGQDGVPGSAAFLDQAELFRRGEYVRVPLDPAAARAGFPHATRLEPASR